MDNQTKVQSDKTMFIYEGKTLRKPQEVAVFQGKKAVLGGQLGARVFLSYGTVTDNTN